MTNVPQPNFGPMGFIAPPPSAVLVGVLADINQAFGGGLSQNLETPQGQLAVSQTAIIDDGNSQFLFYVQNVDPAYASGRMQDGIGRIYFMTRKPAQPTVVSCTLLGAQGTTVEAGSLAQATDGNLYASVDEVTFDDTGTATVNFQCTVTGPIPCPEGSLNTIYQVTPGWDSITNPVDGVIGRNVENRADFEFRRQQSVAANAQTIMGAIEGQVFGVADVLDVYTIDNPTPAPVTIGGVSIGATAMYVCVAGGASADIAQAILIKRPPGTPMTGNTTVTAFDNNPAYSSPRPYSITYQTAIPTGTVIAVTIKNSVQVPSNAQTLVQNAVLAAFTGQDNGPRARIGDELFASRYYAGIAALGTWAQIVSVLMGTDATPDARFTAAIAGATMTVSAVSAGALAVGQLVIAPGVLDGTFITALGTGSGGTGTYTVANSQTVTSVAMTSVAPDGATAQLNINQVPTLATTNVKVVFV